MPNEIMQFLVWLLPIVPQLVEAFKAGKPAVAVLAANDAAWKAAKNRLKRES